MNRYVLNAFIEKLTETQEYTVRDNWIYNNTEGEYVGRINESKIQLIYGEYPRSSLTIDMFILREDLQAWELPFEEVVSTERMKDWCGTVEKGKKGAMEHFRYMAKEFSDLADRVENMASIKTP